MTAGQAHDVFFDWHPDTQFTYDGYTFTEAAAAQVPADQRDTLKKSHQTYIEQTCGLMASTWREQQALPETITLPVYDVDGYPDLQEVGFFKRKDNTTIFYYGGVFTHQELKNLRAKDQE